jgi:prepilin-type N-terminal cleavage/methylation domain-containing protein
MGDEEHHHKHDHFGSIAMGTRGFTLLELMVALLLSSVVALVAYNMLGRQTQMYVMQDDVAEMQQNLRVAAERISRDLRMAAMGKPSWTTVNQADVSSWYNSANGYRAYNISGSGSNFTLDVMGCIEGTARSTSADVASGSNTITVTAQSGVEPHFNITTRQDINIGGVENAKISACTLDGSGNCGTSLTIDTNPSVSGDQALQSGHPAGTLICVVKWVTYSRGASDNLLYVDEHDGVGNRPLAQGITGLTFSAAGNLITFTITGRTKRADATTGQYMTSQLTSNVSLRN